MVCCLCRRLLRVILVEWCTLSCAIDSRMSDASYYFNAAGLLVMTEAAHLERGHCCGRRCLHCPYEHEAVAGGPEVVLPLRVRRAEQADASRLAVLGRQVTAAEAARQNVEAAARLVPWLAATFTTERVLASLAQPNEVWLVAEDAAGELWGYGGWRRESEVASLLRLCVRRQAHEHGVSDLLRAGLGGSTAQIG